MSNKKKLEQQKQRRAKNVQAWLDLGIDRSIISRYDLRNKNPDKVRPSVFTEIKKESKSAKIKATKKRKAQERQNYLTGQGFKKSEIKKSWLHSDKALYKALGRTNPNEVFTANKHLALAFTNLHGASGILNTSAYKSLSFEEVKERIQDRISEAEQDPDGSDSLTCVFQMFHGSEDECEQQLEGFSKRGYNLSIKKLTDRRYYRLVNRNDWTMREYAEMMLCVLEQCHNKDVPMLVDQFRYYIDEAGLPFNEIFN